MTRRSDPPTPVADTDDVGEGERVREILREFADSIWNSPHVAPQATIDDAVARILASPDTNDHSERVTEWPGRWTAPVCPVHGFRIPVDHNLGPGWCFAPGCQRQHETWDFAAFTLPSRKGTPDDR